MFGLITGLIWVDSWIVELCIWNMNFLLMYFKFPYDFTILRSVFTIQVYFAFFVPCQNRDFNNLGVYPDPSLTRLKKHGPGDNPIGYPSHPSNLSLRVKALWVLIQNKAYGNTILFSFKPKVKSVLLWVQEKYFISNLVNKEQKLLPQSLDLPTELSIGICTIIPLVINLLTKSPIEMLHQWILCR